MQDERAQAVKLKFVDRNYVRGETVLTSSGSSRSNEDMKREHYVVNAYGNNLRELISINRCKLCFCDFM